MRKKTNLKQSSSWVFEALLLLMKDKPYSEISVSEITAKAGIVRQTFYHKYKDKDDIIYQYLSDIFNNDFLSVENSGGKNNLVILKFNLKNIVKQRSSLKKIMSGFILNNLIPQIFNEWQKILSEQIIGSLSLEEQIIYRYKVYYQVTGIIRVIMEWILNDMPVPMDNLVKLLESFTADTKTQYKNIPNIRIQLES